MSVRRSGLVSSSPGRKKLSRGVACLLAFGLLFPGGAAIAAPEELPANDDAVAVESVDRAPVETAADPVATNASVSADLDVVEFKDAELKKCVAAKLGQDSAADISSADLKSIVELTCADSIKGGNIVDITPLQHATGLTSLRLRYNRIVDISPVSTLTNLTVLDLRGNQVTDVSSLAGLINLKYLDLGFDEEEAILVSFHNRIVDVSPLAGLDSLQVLDLSYNEIVDLSPLAGLSKLTSLNLDRNEIIDVSPLAGLSKLTSLNLNRNQIIDLSPLAGLTKLTNLNLQGCSDQSGEEDGHLCIGRIVDVSPLAGLTSLQVLDLLYNKIVDVSPLAGLTKLTSLNLNHNQIIDLSPLAGLTKLTNLNLQGCWGQSDGHDGHRCTGRIVDVSPLAGLTSLQVLDLSYNKIVDVSPLAGLTKLENLSLDGQQVALADATSGVPFSLPVVRWIDGTSIQIDTPPVEEGDGEYPIEVEAMIVNNVVWWYMPSGGDGSLTWLKEFKLSASTVPARFSGGMAQKVLPALPIESSTPTILGTAQVGQTLTADPGKWSEGTSFMYQWLIDGHASDDPVKSPSFTLTPSELGDVISVTVIGSKPGYVSVSKTSEPMAKVAAATLTAATPTISGTAQVGQKLTANPGSWTPSPVTFSYEWLNDGIPISGATNPTYTLSKTDMGAKISVKVTGSKYGYTTVSKTSVATTTVVGRALKAATPTISGTAQVGKKLTADPGMWTEGTDFTYQWLADGKAIKDATKSTYALKTAQQGKAITVTVTGSKSGFKSVSKTSAPTAKVQAKTVTKVGWVQENGKWYYYANGAKHTGWLSAGGAWYYMNSSGVMQTGWVSVGGTWYYMASSGAMKTGWVTVSGTWYYLASSGAMQTGWVSVSGTWYFMSSSGAMQTGWVSTGGSWYYMKASGAMHTGWLKLGSAWYYLKSSGAMVTGTYVIDGVTHRFNSSGVWLG